MTDAGSTTASQLSAVVTTTASDTVVTSVGEINVSTSAIAPDQLTEELLAGTRCLIADLTGITFRGSAGLNALTRPSSRPSKAASVDTARTAAHTDAIGPGPPTRSELGQASPVQQQTGGIAPSEIPLDG